MLPVSRIENWSPAIPGGAPLPQFFPIGVPPEPARPRLNAFGSPLRATFGQ